jgi:hypothetical protein
LFINGIRDLIVKCKKFRGQVENGHFKKTAPFLDPLFSAFFLAQGDLFNRKSVIADRGT